MTIELKAKSKTLVEAEKAVPRAPNLGEISALDPLQQGQGLRAASKKRKKQRKRAGNGWRAGDGDGRTRFYI